MDKSYRIHNCHSCYYRHRCRRICWSDSHIVEALLWTKNRRCRLWRLGKCYTCRYLDAPEDDWFRRGCEAECFGGCRKYERDWGKTLAVLMDR